MITTSSLYFSQINVLKKLDPYEGSQTLSKKAFYTQMYTDEKFARSFMGIPESKPLPLNYPEFWHPNNFRAMQDNFAATAYVNCWHISEHESAFLWSVYSSTLDGVCVKSNIGDLQRSMENVERDIYIGPVEYIDYTKDHVAGNNSFNPIFRKRKSFQAERELRLCLLELLPGVGWSPSALTRNPPGIAVKCDLNVLINQILISPSAPEWFNTVVSDVVTQLGHKFPISKSAIGGPVIF